MLGTCAAPIPRPNFIVLDIQVEYDKMLEPLDGFQQHFSSKLYHPKNLAIERLGVRANFSQTPRDNWRVLRRSLH